MADTTALKNRIRAAIKANDNQEITGPVLQQTLLDIVDELNGATETEANTRQSADNTLQQNINKESQQRQNADSTLSGMINSEIQRAQGAESDLYDEIYSLFFKNIPDKNIKQIKELYLSGLNSNADYLARVYIQNGTKRVQICNADNTANVASGDITNNTFVVLNEQDSSGVNGYAILTTTDITHIALSNCAKLNVQNVSNLNLSPSIKEIIDINTEKNRAEGVELNLHQAIRNLLNTGYAFGGIAETDTNPGIPSGNCFYIVRGAGTYTFFKNADDESIIFSTDGIYVLTYESTENQYWEWNSIINIDNVLTINSNNIPISKSIIDKLYNQYFSEVKDEGIYQIKSLYLNGLDTDSIYYARTAVVNTTKYIQVFDYTMEIVAAGTINSNNLIAINEINQSGITGYCLIENTDIANIATGNACRINNARVSKISNDIRIALNEVYFPIFGNKNILSDYFAGEIYGYPYLILTQSQLENEPTLNTLRGLVLSGLDNTKKYYLKFNHGSSTHYIDIYDETKTIILARGSISISDSIIPISELNNSGINGKAKLHFNDASLLINTHTLINTHSIVINANPIESIDSEIAYLQNNIFGPSLKELYFEGLNQNSEYRIRAYVGSNYTQFQLFLGSGTSNVVAIGTISGNSDKICGIFELSPRNNSNIHGYIYYDGNSFSANTNRAVINNTVVSDINNSPSIKKYEEDNPIIVDSSYGYSPSLLRGIIKAETFMNKKVLVNNGEYDIEAEFKEYYGNDFFDNWVYSNDAIFGIHLKNGVHVIFSSGAKVVFNYSGNNSDVKQRFAPFNSMPHSSDAGFGFILENLNLEASNCRYCIHDERNSMTDPYTNKYINCSMVIDNSNNELGYHTCIGGGLGKNGYIEISGCKFKSVNYNTLHTIVSYHNSEHAQAQSKIVIKNNYCEGLGTFRATWHGTSTKLTDVLICGNSVGSPIVVAAETGSDTVENINVLQWNNEIRV